MDRNAFILQFEELPPNKEKSPDICAYDEKLQMIPELSTGVTHILTDTGGSNDVDTGND